MRLQSEQQNAWAYQHACHSCQEATMGYGLTKYATYMAKLLRYLATGHTQQDYSFMQNEPLATSLSEKVLSSLKCTKRNVSHCGGESV